MNRLVEHCHGEKRKQGGRWRRKGDYGCRLMAWIVSWLMLMDLLGDADYDGVRATRIAAG